MKEKPVDYSATLIYKITCKDPTITDLYVGHTTNFVQRREQHKQCSVKKSSKLYNVIRNNGGWTNWTMEIVNFFNCKNLNEAKTKEQEYFVDLNATLNSIEPMPNKKEKVIKIKKINIKKIKIKPIQIKRPQKENLNINKFSCEKCKFMCSKKIDWERHVVRPKHLRVLETTPKKIPEISCEKCKFKCYKKRDWLRHISTPKHIKNIENKEQKTVYSCKNCNNTYLYSSGLWKHSKTCNVENLNRTTDVNKMDTSLNTDNYKRIIEGLIKEHSDFKNIALEMVKNNIEMHKKILELLQINY
jgi:hypothetical protein